MAGSRGCTSSCVREVYFFRESVPSLCADEKPEREGTPRAELSFTSRQAGLSRLSRPLLLRKGCKKKFVTPLRCAGQGPRLSPWSQIIEKASGPVDKSVDK